MKKILALVLVLALVAALFVGCQNTPETTKPAETKPAETKPVETEPPAPAGPLADEDHNAWVAHGQFLLADGTENSWNGKDPALYEASSLTAIALDDVKAIDENVYNALAAKEVKYLYSIDLIFGTNDAGWTTNCLKDGKLYRANGSCAFKICPCIIDEGVYSEDGWIPDPKVSHAESLTPDTLFMPVWQEESDDFGFSWASNPVVIGGAGLYTLVIAQYKNASSPEQAGFGIALVLKEAKEGMEYEEVVEFVPADHTYGIVGTINGWGGEGDDIALADNGDGSWSGEVELKADDEFKVRADNDPNWTYNWGDADGNNFKCEADGTYLVTITFTDGNGVVTVEAK